MQKLHPDAAHRLGHEEARSRLMNTAVENLQAFLNGKPQNVVNLTLVARALLPAATAIMPSLWRLGTDRSALWSHDRQGVVTVSGAASTSSGFGRSRLYLHSAFGHCATGPAFNHFSIK